MTEEIIRPCAREGSLIPQNNSISGKYLASALTSNISAVLFGSKNYGRNIGLSVRGMSKDFIKNTVAELVFSTSPPLLLKASATLASYGGK